MSDRPVLLCYDASEDARNAIASAAALLGPREALVLTVCVRSVLAGSVSSGVVHHATVPALVVPLPAA